MQKDALKTAKELLKFIDASPTAYQAAENLAKELRKSGGRELYEKNHWNLKAGETYFVRRNDSALIAFTVPEKAKGFRIFACHGDSPAFKIKENPEKAVRGTYLTLKT